MPLQIDLNKFVRFVYNPAYLQTKKYLKTISDVDRICEQIGIETIKSNILLDGGNVTRTFHNANNDQANGDYINYLQMENTVIVPTFDIKEDDEVVKQFEHLFTGQTIATIDANDIANDGGNLNCISWNILK